jgi:NAD(P)-dependent dehydrogenase (short-subunit alcohol dehydrogenase family)
MDTVAGKVAVVTGGSSGVGLGIARQLAVRGAKVVVVGRDPDALELAREATGGMAVRADVTDPGALRQVASEVVDRFQGLDILVNNAGVGPTARLADMTREDWKWLLDTNLWSVINGLDAFLPLLRANPNGGHIVNTSSISGMFTAPAIGAYAATKYAVVAISETLAQEFAKDGVPIGVSVFLPGPVRSNIHLGSRNRPADDAVGGLRDMRLEDAEGFEGVIIPWMSAEDSGALVVEAILSNRLYVWTHPEGTAPIIDRFRRIEQSIVETAQLMRSDPQRA